MEHRGKAVPRGAVTSPESAMASELFDHFVSAATFKSVLHTNRQLCELLRLKPTHISNFFPRLKAKLHSWRAASLWAKLDKRASHKCYNRGKACPNTRVLIIGAGPCGLRTAIEAQLLGAKVVVVEKRDRFSRNNVLHLWPFVIHDLRSLGSKKFFGKFCAGSIDHISIRQLQIILLKVALLLGVEVHENVGFEGLIEPPEDQSHERIGWRAHVSPTDHPVSQYEFDVLIGADGKRNTLLGFNRKEFRGKLAIAVTANFINKHSPEEARVPEISGVAFIFNQKFFQDMKEQTAIDLENIVYYKDDTHYFVMTAKKQSLLERGVIIQDYADTARLLASENVDREALMEYARDAADFATSGQLPHLDFAVNHYGQADVAMFDFTSMYAAENACRVVQKREHKLLQGLVGDSLLEPFWPTGSGCARGFLSAFDAGWMIRSWASGKLSTLQVLAERESIYRLLAQTTPENLSKDLNQYTLNPSSRYPNLNLQAVLPSQVRSLFNTDGKIEEIIMDATVEAPKKKRRRESMIHPDTLLNWCKKQVALSDKVKIQDFTSSWKDGLALCTILHHYRPDLIDTSALDPENIAKNNQLAFDICERELGIPPVMTGQEMAECTVPDKLTMVAYISQVYESFRGEIPVVSHPKLNLDERTVSPNKLGHVSPLLLLNKVSSRFQGKRKYSVEKELAKERERGENVKKRSSIFAHKRRSRDKAGFIGDKNQDIILTDYKSIPINKPRESINTRVKNLEAQMKKDAGLRCHQSGEMELTRPPHGRSEQSELNIKMLKQQLQSSEKDPNAKKARSPKVGKLRKDEWNVKIIEEKIKQVKTPPQKNPSPEKPKIFKEIFTDKLHAMNEVLKAGGSLTPEEAAKYREFDSSLSKLKTRLTKGNLETGERGHNQIAAMSEHMTTVWDKKDSRRKHPLPPAPVKMHEETDSQKSAAGSNVCYFCKGRVYLMQHLSAEGLFFHRTCFKCEYCGAILRLGDYAFDKDAGGKFYCIAHFRMQKTDLRQQEMMKRKQAFLTCALEPEKEKIYQAIRDNTEKALSPGRQAGTTSPTVTDSNVPAMGNTEAPTSPSNFLTEPVGTFGRDQTPERVEYENSILELSEDELLTSELEEEELTQKNLGPSQDLATSEDDYSDLSTDSETDEEAFAEELERSLTADETRKLAETWNRKYSAEQSLIYNLSTSSADDEGSETEIGSDDTSHDIDSDAEYSVENSEEDGVKTKESENPPVSKTPEEKEFSMEVPIIDLKSMNRVSEDETTSESEQVTDEDGDSENETGTEVDSEESESESTPPPPQQIPTIVIYESPPQNTELDQEWNENHATAKIQEETPVDVANFTINISSDSSISQSDQENQDREKLDREIIAEADSDFKIDDGKCIEITDKDKNDDSLSSRVEGKVLEDEILEVPELNTPTRVIAPLAVGESSSDLSVSSEIDSLAKDIVSDVMKAAESTIIDRLSPKDQVPTPESFLSQNVNEVDDKIVEEEPSKVLCSTPFSKAPVICIASPETPSTENTDTIKTKDLINIEEIDLCSPSPQNTIIVSEKEVNSLENTEKLVKELFPTSEKECGKTCSETNIEIVDKEPVKEIIPNKEISEACVNDTVVLDDSDLPMSDESIDASRNTTSFITIRKKNNSTKNESLDWDSDKSVSVLPVYYEEEICIDDFNPKRNVYTETEKPNVSQSNAQSVPNHDLQTAEDSNESCKLSSQIDLANSCLSQSLPSSSTSFLLESSFPKTVSYTSAEFENAKLEKLASLKNYSQLSTSELKLKQSDKSLLDEKPSKLYNKGYLSGNSKDSLLDSLDNSKLGPSNISASKSEPKYKGYSGSFAEKVRPKSLFCDAIYLRSLDIKLTKQPFSSLNKSDDNLDEQVESKKDAVKKHLFEDSAKASIIVSNKPDAKKISSGNALEKEITTSSALKSISHTEKVTNNNANKHKNCHKQSSVSFCTDSYGDLVSPYNCNQSKPSELSFPTKVKPKCDLDIAKLRQKREKRKSVHEDLQGLPFADEDKLVSPVDPLSSSEVFVPPKVSSNQDKGSSTPTNEQFLLPQYTTPDMIDEERYLRMQSTVEQKKAREEARARARLKSDEELGLSPNNYRKKYRRQLSLNSINYDELCSDEFCDQEEEELEDSIINNFCHTQHSGIEDTFSMFKSTDLYPDSKTADMCIVSSQQCSQPTETNPLPSSSDELIASTDSLDTVESSKSQKLPQNEPKQEKHSSLTSSSETSPEVCALDSPFDSKLQAKSNSKNFLVDSPTEDEKFKPNGKKSIFSILNFGKSNVSKEKTKQKSKGTEKDLSSSLPSDIGARTNPKGKTFSNLKLSISKEKGSKPKAKSVPPESVPSSPLESIYSSNQTPYISFGAQQSKIVPKYTVYRNPETALTSFPEPTISTFPVHLPVPKMENGLAPKASEDSFSDEDDTQGTKAGHPPSTEKNDKNEKERKAQRIVQKVQRQQILKRMRNAQEMQRRLEELEIQQKEIEMQGVQLEKILRGEHHGINGGKGETELEQEWYTLVHTKNQLTREVQEIYIRLKDIELEERQSRLQQDFTQRMADGYRKNQTQLIEERKILDEMLQIVDKRNELVKVLDQLKLREEEDEIIIGSDVFTKGLKSPLSPSEKS